MTMHISELLHNTPWLDVRRAGFALTTRLYVTHRTLKTHLDVCWRLTPEELWEIAWALKRELTYQQNTMDAMEAALTLPSPSGRRPL